MSTPAEYRAATNGGETWAQLATRAQAAIDDIVRMHKSGNLLIVSHGHTLRLLLALMQGATWQNHREAGRSETLHNTAINIVRYRIKELKKQYKEKHPSLDKKGLAPLMAEEKKEIQDEFSEKVNNLKEELQDAFLTEKQKKLKDYPIFMAIAEEIGYDATGKKTAVNELEIIGIELKRFIKFIENK